MDLDRSDRKRGKRPKTTVAINFVVMLLLLTTAVTLFPLCTTLTAFTAPNGNRFSKKNQQSCSRTHSPSTTHNFLSIGEDDIQDEIQNAVTTFESNSRRRLLQGITSSLSIMAITPSVSHAGEWGERLNRAVTQSELGIQVRREVVRGAQILDQLDGQWEQFSDRLQLGTERSKQDKRPAPKKIPPLRPLDVSLAKQSLQICDQVFVDATKVSSNELEQTIKRIADLVQPSFQRAGLKSSSSPSPPLPTTGGVGNIDDMVNAEQFNFWSYVHFRAYADLLLTTPRLQRQLDKNNYSMFKSRLEADLGQRLLALMAPDLAVRPTQSSLNQNDPSAMIASPLSSPNRRWSNLHSSLTRVEELLSKLVQAGWVASTDISQVEEDALENWLDGLSDLSLSIALDGDVTLGAQTLLQEQGFRLYPNYAKWAAAALLSQSGETVQVDEYYFDTDYNPDPSQYQVKEVLLNVVVQS